MTDVVAPKTFVFTAPVKLATPPAKTVASIPAESLADPPAIIFVAKVLDKLISTSESIVVESNDCVLINASAVNTALPIVSSFNIALGGASPNAADAVDPMSPAYPDVIAGVVPSPDPSVT